MTYQGYLCLRITVALFEDVRVDPHRKGNLKETFFVSSTNKWSNFDSKDWKSQMQMVGLRGNQMGKMLENLG